ncbi:MAG: hypothetical protein H7X85_11950 [Thermoanaerobaculia bacterium]|nr:hypothetical protein [Thermoanaerobaculia bacterium]
MTSFAGSLARVAAAITLFWVVGYVAVRVLVPPRPRSERIGWGFAAGSALLAAATALTFALGLKSAWPAFVVLAILSVFAGVKFPVRGEAELTALRGRLRWPEGFWAGVAILGVLLYAFRALTEPMWAGDFLAIWGLKGKSFFAAGFVPHLFEDALFGFTHPEYPVGLPLLYAGIALAVAAWDDHAMALLFPCFLAATLLVLYGFLRRRGASAAVALAATALLANFQGLYSAFLTGMAEVPLALALLLLATSLADAWDARGDGAMRRVAAASFLAGGTKNEGLLLVGLGLLMTWALFWKGRTRARVGRLSFALLAPAVFCAILHRVAFGNHPLRDFDLALLGSPELPARFAAGLRIFFSLYVWPQWAALLLLAGLLLAGRSVPAANRMLILCAAAVAIYLALPALAVQGPEWLVTWSLGRTVAALAPIAAAAVALRLSAD